MNRTSTMTLGSPARAGATGTEPAAPAHCYDIALLLLRLAVGLTMAAHGSQKLFGWFDGGGIDGTAAFFGASGYDPSRPMAVVAGLSETLGGLGLALGLLTPAAAAAVIGTLVNAIAVKWGGGFFSPAGVEYELMLTAVAVTLALSGPGRIAVDRQLPVLRAHRLVHGVAAVLGGALGAAVVLVFFRN